MTCPKCEREIIRPIIRQHPITGRDLPAPICRDCAETIVREKPGSAPKGDGVHRRMVKQIGDT